MSKEFSSFYCSWHPSFIIRASSIAEPMVNKDELIKGYVIKAQNSISKTQTSHYPAFEFMFSVFHMFPPSQQKKHNFCFGVNRKPSTKKLPAPPANLGSCRPGPVVQPTCLGDPKNPPTFNPVRCSSDFRQPRLSSISTKSQGLKKCPRFFGAVHSQASLKNAKNVMMDK